MNKEEIFAPATIGGIELRNRALRSATHEGMADENGMPTHQLIALYERLAKGGVGAVITGYMGISEEGRSTYPGMVLIDKDDKIEPLHKLVENTHAAGVPIIAEIAHCGNQGKGGKNYSIKNLSETDIRTIIQQFVDAAVRARKAGFDGIELHCAHSYLLAQFISPLKNHRHDQWGSNAENRFRIIKEIMQGIRKQLPDYPVWAKINGTERGGMKISDAVTYSKMLELCGINAIEVSSGIAPRMLDMSRGSVPLNMIYHDLPGIRDLPHLIQSITRPFVADYLRTPDPIRRYNVPAALAIKKVVSISVIAVGGIADLDEIESTLNKGADAVSICRPLILNPNLIAKYRDDKQTTSACIRCNHCLIGIAQRTLRCYYGKMPKD